MSTFLTGIKANKKNAACRALGLPTSGGGAVSPQPQPGPDVLDEVPLPARDAAGGEHQRPHRVLWGQAPPAAPGLYGTVTGGAPRSSPNQQGWMGHHAEGTGRHEGRTSCRVPGSGRY